VEFESGSDLYTSVIKNGKVYNFSTVSSAGTVAPIKRNPQFQFGPEVLQSKIHLKAYLTSVNAKVTGEETYQGQRCFVYKYDYSDGESQVLNTLWVWKKAFFPLKTEMRINSNDIVTIYYDAVRINDDIADRRFDLPKNIRFYSE
jgi:outer membrane lipoprotein-sorting protein